MSKLKKVRPTRLLSLPVLVYGLLGGIVLLSIGLAVHGGPFTSKGTQPGLTHALLEPGTCGSCHGNFDSANHTEPYDSWSGSMMANSSRDPLFWAALDVANNDVPGVGDFCLRCHVPTGWLEGRSEPPGGTTDGCSMVGDIDNVDNDFSGVSCHLCHRMMVNSSPPMGEDPVYYENGQFWLDDADCTGSGTGPCRRGPYDYAGAAIPPPHQWAFSQYHVDSDICGNCHNVTSPAETLIDETGTDTGIPYPVERTFKEWQQSDFSVTGAGFQSCQNCHMPDAQQADAYACIQQQNNRTGNMPVHRFVGANTWVPAILRDEYTNLGRTAAFNQTIAWATELLQNDTATVEVTAPTMSDPGDDLAFDVRVTNLSGHKLPTGYTEGRRMWINAVVRDANGDVVWESGAYDASTGDLTEDSQIKIYASERGIWNRNGTNECDVVDEHGSHIFHFVLNNCIKSDNRIPPLGFTGGTDPETRPVGYTYPETSPGSGVLVNYDITPYTVTIPPGTPSPVSVEARLYFQIASKDYIEFLRDQAIDNSFPDDCITRDLATDPNMSRGEWMYTLWTNYGRAAPVQVNSDAASVDVSGTIFEDGFESGNLTSWSSSVG